VYPSVSSARNVQCEVLKKEKNFGNEIQLISEEIFWHSGSVSLYRISFDNAVSNAATTKCRVMCEDDCIR
jgi:hypothetical protein